jgi:hypothetical protein
VDIVADGFKLKAWQEPQLAPLQKLLAQINLTPFLKESLHDEQVSALRIIQTVMAQFEFRREPNATLWQKIKNVRPPNILHGFFCFNILNTVRMDQMIFDSVNAEQNIVWPQKVAKFNQEMDALGHHSNWRIVPYNFFVVLVPNWQKAIQTFARNQTEANQAEIVCALERHRLSHGAYPTTLEELVEISTKSGWTIRALFAGVE